MLYAVDRLRWDHVDEVLDIDIGRGEHWGGGVHGSGSGGADGTQGVGLGISDVIEMPAGSGCGRDSQECGDGRGADWKLVTGDLGGPNRYECDRESEPGVSRVGVGDSRGGEYGGGRTHGKSEGGGTGCEGTAWVSESAVEFFLQ